MKRKTLFVFIIFLLSLFFSVTLKVEAYDLLYAEQFYRLFHYNFYRYPEDYNENIFFLEKALKADFCNPLNALATIENKREWERYRNLFKLHVNLKLAELYLGLASKYDKQVAYFYNEPWKDDNLKSLKVAEQTYKKAYYYWEKAVEWSAKLDPTYIDLEEVRFWEDENFRIREGELDYEDIIDSHLKRLKKVEEAFLRMDENTY